MMWITVPTHRHEMSHVKSVGELEKREESDVNVFIERHTYDWIFTTTRFSRHSAWT